MNMQHRGWFKLPPAMEYYYQQKNPGYKPLPPFRPGCDNALQPNSIELIYPQAGEKIYVPYEMDGARGNTVFKAAHARRGSRIFWSLDGQYLSTTENFHQLGLAPPPGRHVITLTDESGYSISRVFYILEKEKE